MEYFYRGPIPIKKSCTNLHDAEQRDTKIVSDKPCKTLVKKETLDSKTSSEEELHSEVTEITTKLEEILNKVPAQSSKKRKVSTISHA